MWTSESPCEHHLLDTARGWPRRSVGWPRWRSRGLLLRSLVGRSLHSSTFRLDPGTFLWDSFGATRPTDLLYEIIRVVGRCRPVKGLDGNFDYSVFPEFTNQRQIFLYSGSVGCVVYEVVWVFSMTKMAQVEMRTGRAEAPARRLVAAVISAVIRAIFKGRR